MASPGRPTGLAPAELVALVLATHQQVNDAPQPAAGPAIPGFAAGDDAIDNELRRKAAELPSRPLATVLDERRSAGAMQAFSLHELVRAARAGLSSAERPRFWRRWRRRGPVDGTARAVGRCPSIRSSCWSPQRPSMGSKRADTCSIRTVSGMPRLAPAWMHYASEVEAAAMRAARASAPAPATVVLVANADRIADRYSAPLTLLMRDAGVLLQTLHLVATDLGLVSRILGSAGHTTHADGTGDLIVDCGALVIGAR